MGGVAWPRRERLGDARWADRGAETSDNETGIIAHAPRAARLNRYQPTLLPGTNGARNKLETLF